MVIKVLDLVPLVGGQNVYHLTTLLSVLGTMGYLETAFLLYQRMIKRNVVPTVVTYTALLNGCAKQGDIGRAFGILQQMKERNVAPNEVILFFLHLLLFA